MLISHSQRFILLHNPKAGGSSLRKALLPYCDDDRYRYMGFVNGEAHQLSHLPYSLALPLLEQTFGDSVREYTVLVCVRDPYQRFLSAASEFHKKHADWYSKFGMPLEDFLWEMLTPDSINLTQFHWFRRQSAFVPPLSEAPNRIILAAEHLNLSSHYLSQRLGVKEFDMPEENTRAERDDPVSTFSSRVRSQVASLYESDYTFLEHLYPLDLSIEYPRQNCEHFNVGSYLHGNYTLKKLLLAGEQATAQRLAVESGNPLLADVLHTPPVSVVLNPYHT